MMGMLTDNETNLVYVADKLAAHHPSLVAALSRELGPALRVISGTSDIWCRDYMPIQLSRDRFVQFRYEPSYLAGHREAQTSNGWQLLPLPSCQQSPLVIDGGNVVRGRDVAIVTDRIYRENRCLPREDVRRQLIAALSVNRLIIIPADPDDIVGHADGMVRLVNDETVLMSDYRALDPKFDAQLVRALTKHGLAVIRMPFCPTDELGDDPDISSAAGVYINYLHVGDQIFVPAFGLGADDAAAGTLRETFPHCTITPIDCTALARGGGVLNCATWNVKDWPVSTGGGR